MKCKHPIIKIIDENHSSNEFEVKQSDIVPIQLSDRIITSDHNGISIAFNRTCGSVLKNKAISLDNSFNWQLITDPFDGSICLIALRK